MTTAPDGSAYCEIDFPQPSSEGRLRLVFDAPEAVLSADRLDDVPALLRKVEAFAQAGYWAVGQVGYEAGAAFDAAYKTHAATQPLAMFAIYRRTAGAARPRGEFLCGAWRDATDRAAFDAAIAQIRHAIAEGDYYQVNYCTRLSASFRGDSLAFFDALRASQPAAYCAYLDFGRWQTCSVSPELFFRWDAAADGRTLSSRPMKGTAARDAEASRDRAAAEQLRRSPKECAENLMIVDLIRNDLSRVARLGTVEVPALFSVESWPTVWQMTSTVACRTHEGASLADVFGALFPCGSITGAPKAAAMAAIATLERAPRGVYCGAVGIVEPGGAATFNVGIRTVAIDARRGMAECGIGSGITFDSDSGGEYAEWGVKRLFLQRACPDYRLLETLRLRRGRYTLLRGHLGRLAASAAALGFACDRERIIAALAATASAHADGDWRVRLCLAADGSPLVEAFRLEATPRLAAVATAAAPIASGNPWLCVKTTRRDFYDVLAVQRPGVFDTLLWNERGEVTEFTRGNLVVELDGRRLTPPLSSGLLPGVLRAVLLARGAVREAVITRDDLRRATNLWFINSVRGAIPVRLAGVLAGRQPGLQ